LILGLFGRKGASKGKGIRIKQKRVSRKVVSKNGSNIRRQMRASR
jgi:hypothetical protein